MKKILKLSVLTALFLPPAILSFYWYLIEHEEYYPFQNFEVRGLQNISPETVETVHDLTSAWYEYTKDNFPVQFEKQKKVSDFENFESEVSESVTEKLGIFSLLPYHKVCLINRNKVYINGALTENQSPNIGATAINQENGYKFYANRGEKDCHGVLIKKFRDSSSSPELVYPISINISTEENIKRINGEKYVVDLATTSVGARETSVTISLRWWTMLLAYFLLLFAWSFIFFQYEKILNFLRALRGTK